MTEDAVATGLERAAQLFNDARYHDAHEVLDELWEHAAQRDSDFLKGLIQACIALHHWQRGNAEGARKLYSGHRQYLGAYLPAYRALDVAQFLAAMQASLAPLVRARPGAEPGFDAERRPRLEFATRAQP